MGPKKKPVPVPPPKPAPMDKPSVRVVITWPKVGSHSAAMQRIGRGMALLIEQMTEKRVKESNNYGIRDSYTETVEHFTVTSRHEVEP